MTKVEDEEEVEDERGKGRSFRGFTRDSATSFFFFSIVAGLNLVIALKKAAINVYLAFAARSSPSYWLKDKNGTRQYRARAPVVAA